MITINSSFRGRNTFSQETKAHAKMYQRLTNYINANKPESKLLTMEDRLKALISIKDTLQYTPIHDPAYDHFSAEFATHNKELVFLEMVSEKPRLALCIEFYTESQRADILALLDMYNVRYCMYERLKSHGHNGYCIDVTGAYEDNWEKVDDMVRLARDACRTTNIYLTPYDVSYFKD